MDTLPIETPQPASTFSGVRGYAELSPDARHRYLLARRWDSGTLARFVMLNPSTADATTDDPTIRRCIAFAKAWGHAGIHVVNLYALRSTDPKGLWATDYADRVGEENDEWLECEAAWARTHDLPIVAAWGANAEPRRVAEVLAIPGMDRLQALHITKRGQPGHPLYLPASSVLQPWSVGA